MKKIALLLLPIYIFASDDTDIVPRTVNFIIFMSVLVYLISGIVKNLYVSRINNISNKLKSIEVGLEESKRKKEDAIKKIETANIEAEKIIMAAKTQASKINENILQEAKNEIENMQKSFAARKEFEEKQAELEVINEVLDELINKKLSFSQDELVKLIGNKVGAHV